MKFAVAVLLAVFVAITSAERRCMDNIQCASTECCQIDPSYYDGGSMPPGVVSRKKRSPMPPRTDLLLPSGRCSPYLQVGQYCSDFLAGQCGCAPGLYCATAEGNRYNVCTPRAQN